MAWFDDLELPGSTITGRFAFVHEDGPDEDDYPDVRLASGTVRFEATAKAVKAGGAWIGIAPVEAEIFDGELITSEDDPTPPRILSTDADTGIENWGWRATFDIRGANIKPVTFKAPESGVHLTSGDLLPITGNPVEVVAGPPGDSAYEVAVGGGFEGTKAEWLESLKGDQGDEGDRGPEGPYGGTEVTDPQVASYVTGETETRSALEAAYRRSVSVMEYGATGDGQTDDTTAVQAALNTGGSVYFPPGHYRLTADLVAPSGTTISGADAPSVLLDWSGTTGWNGPGFLSWEAGTYSDPSPLTVATTVGDATVTVSPGHTFQAGDYVRITSDEVAFTEAVKAEYQRVRVVDGDVLTLSAPVFDTYSATMGARVERANLASAAISGVTIRGKGINPNGFGDNALTFTAAKDVHVNDVRFEDVENRCIYLASVLGANINDCHFRFDVSHTALQYGIAINGASQMIAIRGCSSWNDRHMVTTSTSPVLSEAATTGRGIPRIITVTGCTAHGSWQCSIDTHRGGEYLTVTGCALTSELGGVKSRGSHTLVTGNVIAGKPTSVDLGPPYGVRIGMRCEDVQITANLIRGFDSAVRIDTPDSASNRGMVVSENSLLDCVYGVFLGGTTPYNDIRIAGNTIRARADGFGVYLFAHVNDMQIDGNTFIGGGTGVYCASSARNLVRTAIQANTFHAMTARAMWLLNIDTGLVASNFAPGLNIRFHGDCPDVTASLNIAGSITDTSVPGVTTV